MLTPEYLQGLPAELEKLYLRLEEEIIADICRRIAKVGHISDTAEYQILRMRELGAGTEYIKSKIKEYSGLSDDVVDQLFFDAAQVSDEFYKGAYDKAGKEYKPFEYNDFFQQIVVANVNQTKGELSNLTQSMGFSYRGSNGERRFRPVATAYRECLDYAFTQVETGTTDYITAIRNATRRLTESGLQFVDYESGVVNHVDVAVRRAVLTGISQVTGKISEHNAAELETDIVEVTAHAGARPDHAEWQGGWYSLSGKSKKYRSLAEATGYGRVDGLKGANCRHDFFPVIEGIDTPLYTKEELANIDPPPFEYNGKRYTYYEATQKQRSMERAIRKTKREILAADKSGDKDRFTEKSIRLRRQREEYDKFSKSAGLLTQNERNQVVGFGRSEASRASWAARSAQTSGNGPKGTPPNGGSAAPTAKNYNNSNNTPYKVFAIGELGSEHTEQFKPFAGTLDKSSESGIINYGYEKSVTKAVRERFDKAVKEMTEKFGTITTIRSVGVLDGESTNWAIFEVHSGSIRVLYANKKDCLQRQSAKIQSNYKSEKWSSSHQDHIFRHEIGHAIQKQHELSDPLWKEKKDKILSIFYALPEMQDGIDRTTYKGFKVSFYACNNVDDFISECIAESMTKKPRKTATDVVNILLGVDSND